MTLGSDKPEAIATRKEPGGDLPPAVELDQLQAIAFESRYVAGVELARGGMGRVLLAHDSLLHREVAVKELLSESGPGALERFEREALLTARLQHPGIVSVYELARRESGALMLVMRRVQGVALDEAISKTSTLEQRLKLLGAVIAACDAVAYAHRQRVIHRDLKPANVIVGELGDTVVIDWGLAKDLAAEERAGDAPLEDYAAFALSNLTMRGAVIGTPIYMSPEQARGEQVDVRADVYALGAMLYHLCSGDLPYPGQSSQEVLEELRRAPPPPIAGRVPALPRDLVMLVERAMARKREDRFANAGELADELKRFQTGSLLVSRSYSNAELLLRFLKRNAPLIILSCIFLAVLLAGGIISLRRIVAERDVAAERSVAAEREAKKAKAVSDFLQSTLAAPSPVTGAPETKVLDVLDQATARVGDSFKGQPEVEAALRNTLGVTLRDLTQLDKAEVQLKAALELRTKVLGPDHPDTLTSRSDIVLLHFYQGKSDVAEVRDLWEARKRVLGPDNPDTLSSLADYASVLGIADRRVESDAVFTELVAARTRLFGPDDRRTLLGLAVQAVNLDILGKHKEALAMTEDVYQRQVRVLGADNFDTLYTAGNLAQVYKEMHKIPEAEALIRQTLATQQRTAGAGQYNTLYTHYKLAYILCENGQAAEGTKNMIELEALAKKSLPAGHPMLGVIAELHPLCAKGTNDGVIPPAKDEGAK